MYQAHRWKPSLAALLVALTLASAVLARNDKQERRGKAQRGRSGKAKGQPKTNNGRGPQRGRPVVVQGNRPGSARDYHMGNRVQLRSGYRMENNTTYVPVRAPFEQMGARVQWSGNQARIEYQDRTVLCTPGSRTVIIIEGGQRRTETWQQAPRFYGGQLYVPMRPVMSGLGMKVGYQDGAVSIGAGFFFGL